MILTSKSRQTAVRFPLDLFDAIQKHAKKHRVTMAHIVIDAVRQYLRDRDEPNR